jgi:hypothetical protein
MDPAYSFMEVDSLFATAFGPGVQPTSTQDADQFQSSAAFDFTQIVQQESNGPSDMGISEVRTRTETIPTPQLPLTKSPETDATMAWNTFVLQPCAEFIRQASPKISISTSGGAGSTGNWSDVPCYGPIRIKKEQELQPTGARKFQFLLGSKCKPYIFSYSGTGDLGEEVNDFVEQNDVDKDMAIPIYSAVGACLGQTSTWEIAVSHLRTEDSEATNEAPPSARAPVHGSWSVDTASWSYQDSCHDVEYDSATKKMKCTLRKEFATPTELQERFGYLSTDWRTFNVAEFLELAFQKLASRAEDSWVGHISGIIASATLVTVAQMLHISGKGCECGLDDALEEEAYQLELRRHIMAVLPLQEELNLGFTAYEHAMHSRCWNRPWRRLGNLPKSFCRISKKTPGRSKRLSASLHP